MTDLAYTIPGLGTDDSIRLVESSRTASTR